MENLPDNKKDRQLFQMQKKAYEDIAKAIEKLGEFSPANLLSELSKRIDKVSIVVKKE